jgi:decaprenylphospho-beta-D-erythro-pentofuranosid-2-ulose 2-reductase
LNNKKRIVAIGATSLIAEHCLRQWLAAGPVDVTLVGRDRHRLERVAADLEVRSPKSGIRTMQVDFLDPEAIRRTVEAIVSQGDVDIVLVAHGSLPEHSDCQSNLEICRQALEINAVSPVLFAEAFAGPMEKANRGTLALIGSVAGDRGRKSNYVYGAAKGLVSRYVQGLQHRLAGTGVKVVLIKPGPTDTPMTAHLKEKGAKLAPVEEVAAQVVRAIERGKPTVYAPGKWQIIMLVIMHLPAFIFNKLDI